MRKVGSYVATCHHILEVLQRVEGMLKRGEISGEEARAMVAPASNVVMDRVVAEQSDIQEIAAQVSEVLGMEVKIVSGKKGGIISIKYENWEEMDRFLDKIY